MTPSLLHRPNKRLNEGVAKITTPASFRCLTVALIARTPPGTQYCFWFTLLVEKGYRLVPGATIGFPIIRAMNYEANAKML